MITLANIRRAIYNIYKRLEILEGNSGGSSGPVAQIQSDWNQTDTSAKDYIKNKPTITNGQDGITPHIDPTSKHWMIGTTDTGIVAEGQDGTTPSVPGNEAAVSGGNTLSVVTTGEKYNWNNKANIWRGTQAEYDLIQTPDNNTIYIITPDLP